MTFIIFWAAVLAILFFILGVVCKGLASVFSGAIQAVVFTGIVGLFAGFVIVVLYLIETIVDCIILEGFLPAIGMIFLLFICLGFIALLLGWLGAIIYQIIGTVVAVIIEIVSGILEFTAGICERAYGYFLNVIIKQLEKN